jgi:NAD(P)-dependent dehydrogenase (short-subunit alcohol dehydrogenase family)
MRELEGKVILVTGAASGQGRAVAVAFAKRGAGVAALDVARKLGFPGYESGSRQGLRDVVEACEDEGADAIPLVADVSNDAEVAHAVAAAEAHFGRFDVLFNNAGIAAYGGLTDITEAEWDAMIDINLKGAFLVARHVAPVMKRQRSGVIINNSSVAGLRGMERMCHYAASKFGLVGLTKSWAIELAPFGIRVVSIHPTGVNTAMNDGLAMLEGATPEEIAVRSAGNLLPVPWIEPSDVAEAVLFLASERARFVTGSQFVLDAGLLSR